MFGIGKKSANKKNSQREETSGTKKKTLKIPAIKGPKFQADFRVLRNLSSVLDGSILTSEWVVKKVPFLLFLFVLALVYIGNNYVAQSKVKKIDSISKELKDLHDEHISTKSDLMYFTKRSEVAKRLREMEIKEATKPPFKIYVNKKEGK